MSRRRRRRSNRWDFSFGSRDRAPGFAGELSR
jgi:hypothetical protein